MSRSRQHQQGRIRPLRSGLIPMLVFWCVVMGALYWAMLQYQKPRQVHVQADGAVRIPRAADGHFYLDGTVNAQPVRFMVDTGASLVSVSDELARRAALPAGEPMLFHTANGSRQGRMVEGVRVTLGPHTAPAVVLTNVRVGVGLGVGLSGAQVQDALLGQSFLRHFDIRLERDQMVLQPR